MTSDELRAILRDALETSLEVAHVTEADGELTVATVDGGDYAVRIDIEWIGGLHPARDTHSDTARRALFEEGIDRG